MIINLKSWNLWIIIFEAHGFIRALSSFRFGFGFEVNILPVCRCWSTLHRQRCWDNKQVADELGSERSPRFTSPWNALKYNIGANVVLTSCSEISEEEQNHKIQVTSCWQWRNDYTQLRRHFAVQLVNEEATTTTTPTTTPTTRTRTRTTTRTRTRTIRTRTTTTTTTNLKLVRFCGQVSHLGMYSYINTYIYKDIEYIKYTYIYIYDSLAEPFCLCLCSILEQHATNLSPTADWRSGTTQILSTAPLIGKCDAFYCYRKRW